jgi:AcrR family transcriptional regulator
MKTARPYTMKARAASAEATRQRILAAAREHFISRWYDEVTLQDLARAAGVSVQTVLNHFGGKEGVLAAAADVLSEEIAARRTVTPGDVAAAVDALVGDYEITGDAVVRMLALEGCVPAVRDLLERGRANHRGWVAETFAAGGRLPALVVATDVYAWKLLRRDQGLSRARTTTEMRRLVDGVLSTPTGTESG